MEPRGQISSNTLNVQLDYFFFGCFQFTETVVLWIKDFTFDLKLLHVSLSGLFVSFDTSAGL